MTTSQDFDIRLGFSRKQNDTRHLARAETLELKTDSIECSGARHCSSDLVEYSAAALNATDAREYRDEKDEANCCLPNE
ncbi:hypothetical protein [Stieleria neptunia]|uniref:hypothetical protein n=1 Tax=Stieleria neptunia TaxID=2527979 RepID=UPI00119CFB17|nr:hypothetical protein [Stieleria neptunia]